MNFPLNDWVVKICSGVQNENVADAALQFVIARKGELALFDFRTLDVKDHRKTVSQPRKGKREGSYPRKVIPTPTPIYAYAYAYLRLRLRY